MEEIVMSHPLIKHKISILRDIKTGTKEFREIVSEISMLICYEAMRNVKLEEKEIVTPITSMKGYLLDENQYAFIPILRAGLSMADGVLKLIPNAKIGHIGLYRNEETLRPVRYFYKVPKNIDDREVFLLDPMLATGGSAIAAIDILKDEGIKKINFLCLIAAPEGIKALKERHPDVKIYIGEVDSHLNEHGYIVPGLGDAGDRIFGTK